jgi:hypothetical protein
MIIFQINLYHIIICTVLLMRSNIYLLFLCSFSHHKVGTATQILNFGMKNMFVILHYKVNH